MKSKINAITTDNHDKVATVKSTPDNPNSNVKAIVPPSMREDVDAYSDNIPDQTIANPWLNVAKANTKRKGGVRQELSDSITGRVKERVKVNEGVRDKTKVPKAFKETIDIETKQD